MPKTKTKVAEFLKFKNNPELGLYLGQKQLESLLRAEIENKLEEIRKEMMEELKKKSAELNPTVEGVVKNILKDVKGETGAKGDVGNEPNDSRLLTLIRSGVLSLQEEIRGKQGFQGEKGDNPIAGEDYPTDKQVLARIRQVVSEIVLPQPRDGVSPKKGIDYFTPKDRTEIIKKLKSEIGMSQFLTQLKALKELIEEMKRTARFGGRTVHRGGVDLIVGEVPTGTVNGVNKVFTLTNVPKSNGEAVIVNGVRFKRGGEDYSISQQTITMVIAPPTNSLILVDYQQD